jgi:hypothetical protein
LESLIFFMKSQTSWIRKAALLLSAPALVVFALVRTGHAQVQHVRVPSVNVTGSPAALTIANSIAEVGGPSGIIVDNASASGQASSLYFSNQGNTTCNGTANVGCAIKVTQSGLN